MTSTKFKRLRDERGLTQEETAARLGVHRVTVARWEAGDNDIPEAIARLWERNLTASGRSGPTDRWEGDEVHYVEHDTLERYQGMDAFKVAEAYLYGPSGAALGIILTVSAQDLHAGTTATQAIAEGRKALAALVAERRGEAAGLTENRSDLYTWNGLHVRRVL